MGSAGLCWPGKGRRWENKQGGPLCTAHLDIGTYAPRAPLSHHVLSRVLCRPIPDSPPPPSGFAHALVLHIGQSPPVLPSFFIHLLLSTCPSASPPLAFRCLSVSLFFICPCICLSISHKVPFLLALSPHSFLHLSLSLYTHRQLHLFACAIRLLLSPSLVCLPLSGPSACLSLQPSVCLSVHLLCVVVVVRSCLLDLRALHILSGLPPSSPPNTPPTLPSLPPSTHTAIHHPHFLM